MGADKYVAPLFPAGNHKDHYYRVIGSYDVYLQALIAPLYSSESATACESCCVNIQSQLPWYHIGFDHVLPCRVKNMTRGTQ